MSADSLSDVTSPPQRVGSRRLGVALLVIAVVQLMISLDNTIVNIALPSIQTGLRVSPTSLAWAVTAYALPFGGLLLIGGRAGDLFGCRRVFRIGLVVFTVGSLVGGVAPNQAVLLVGRVLQGVGSAIAAPTALSLLATTFEDGPARNKALGIYGAMGGLGATVGLLLGGVLTEYLDWRAVLFVNVPIAAAVLAGTSVLVDGDRERGKVDFPGALTATVGITSLVYAINRASTAGWSDSVTVVVLAVAVALIVAFVITQVRSGNAMMPLRVVRDRNRIGANLSFMLIGAGMFATYYFLTLYMQEVKGYSALITGTAYLPFALGMGVSAGAIGPKLLARMSPRGVISLGLLLAAGGMAWFSVLAPETSYFVVLLPAMLISGLGLGMAFVATTIVGVSGVEPRDTGIASGLINTAQQIGGALGLAVLSTIATMVTGGIQPGVARATALTDGYTTTFLIGGALYVVGIAVALFAVDMPGAISDRPLRTTG